jgi:AcrR family transcriptional regulator
VGRPSGFAYDWIVKRGKYNLKRRAERQEETRLRITRATLELHETIGPSLTTRSAIAERAGVGRPTVYAHFPDDLSLGLACSSLDLIENPLPDIGPWEEIADPERRLRTALGELYEYFRRREGLWANIQRDQDIPHYRDQPDVRKIMQPIAEHWARMHRVLAEGWETQEGQTPSLVFGAIGVALDFQSWRTMVRKQGMTDEQAVELMAGMVRCAMHG